MTTGGDPSRKLTVMHVVAGLHPSLGGPSRTVVQLADALARRPDAGVTLLSQTLIGEPEVASAVREVDRRVLVSASPSAIRLGLPIRQELKRMFHERHPSIMHSHGLWHPASHWASRAACRHGIPLIVHPRGMLAPWALQYKAWKKRAGMAIFQRRDLESASVLIATSEQEYESIRKLGLRQPVALISNGVVAPRGAVRRLSSHGERVRSALFLSRIHPMKGLLNLLQAWARLSPHGWRLRIAGPDGGDHLAEVMTLARQLGIADTIDFLGEVDGEQKSAIYRDSDLFVLPTFSENFGVVVAEALAHGLPVITTRGAPWEDLETYRCGWWIDIGVEALMETLGAAMALTDEQRQAMGDRGREYVQRYDWDAIAQETVQLYSWASGIECPPGCLRFD